VTDRYESLLAQDAQAVIVAHDCPDHAPAAVAALRAGKDVFSEVTAFHTPAQGVELVETVEATGRAYMMGENCLYENPMMELTHQAFVGALGGLQYAEGDYVHDCRYLALRDGQRYWRSWYPPIFYCTHPLGPILRACRQRPVRVVGMHAGRKLEGTQGGIDMGAMLIQTDCGAAIRILSGFAVNREPASLWVCYYGAKASLETDRWDDKVHLFDPAQQHLHGPTTFRPTGRDGRGYTTAGHYGADGRTMEYWLESLANGLEMPVDVHEASDMTLPGILAYRSSLTGSAPLDVPDFRSPAARAAFRADHLRQDPDEPTRMIS
jgi:predicted dehydrogenase